MGMGKNDFGLEGLTVSYRALGTISIEELAHALIEDAHALKDIYNVRFLTRSRLKIVPTNVYGEELVVRRPAGGLVHYLDIHHFRPACRDYEL